MPDRSTSRWITSAWTGGRTPSRAADQVDHVQQRRALLGVHGGHLGGVDGEFGDLVVVALAQPHDLPVEQVDRGHHADAGTVLTL